MLSGETALTDAIYSACLKQQFGVLYKDKIAADQPPQFSFLSLQLRASIKDKKLATITLNSELTLRTEKRALLLLVSSGQLIFYGGMKIKMSLLIK
jgi:hypothetical protein